MRRLFYFRAARGATLQFAMHIVLNGRALDCAPNTTLAALLNENGYAERRIAVEINREIVPRSAHASRLLSEGDKVEIVQAMGGG